MHKKEEHRLRSTQLLNSRLKELEFEFLSEQLKLSVKLSKLKEKETNSQYLCNRKHFCRIFNSKHNWMKSESDKIFEKVRRFACIVKHVKTFV